MLDELISRRYNGGLITLFATNYYREARKLPAPEGGMVNTRRPDWGREAEAMTLRERVGDRVFSRISEMCEFRRVEGEDFRPSVIDAWDG